MSEETPPTPEPEKKKFQPFLLRCEKCRHARMSTGLTDDLKDLHEYKGCATCGQTRKFRCPMCGAIMKLKRVKPNS